jgi:ankyrin repeat protein
VKVLLKARANVDVENNNITVLELAVQRQHVEIVEMLLDAGADATRPTSYDDGRSLLELAKSQGYIDIANLLQNNIGERLISGRSQRQTDKLLVGKVLDKVYVNKPYGEQRLSEDLKHLIMSKYNGGKARTSFAL